MDIDASIITYDTFNMNDFVYFGNKMSLDNSIQHMGDNLTGEGSGDDESIYIDLNKINH